MSDVEVVVVLGKGVLPDGTLPKLVQHTLNYARRLGKPIIVSGNYWGLLPEGASPMPEAEVMAGYLQVPALLEMQSLDTISNLLLSKRLIDQQGWHTIEIVTSAMHLPRVQYLAERIFHNGYHLQYHGHDHAMTARQWLQARRYEWLAKCYDRWILRKLPAELPNPLQWLEQNHFMYSVNFVRDLLRLLVNRPKHR